MTTVTAVTDNARLQEREVGPTLGGEVGGLDFRARDGIVMEWEVKDVVDRSNAGGCRLRCAAA